MAGWYKKPLARGGHRLIKRGARGRFAQTSLGDLGMNECRCCGKIFAPDMSKFEGQDMINPFEFNKEKHRKICDECSTLSPQEQERMAEARRPKEPGIKCSKCGNEFHRDFSRCRIGPTVDPRLLRKEESRTICHDCEKEQQDDSTR